MVPKDKVIPLRPTPSRISEGPLATLVGYRLKRALNVFQADLAQVLKPFDMRPLTFSALAVISENTGLSQSQLATTLDIERPNLVIVVDTLEERGFIRREQVPEDRRVYALRVTKKGREMLTRVQTAVYAHEHRLLEDQSQDQIRILIKALKAIEAKGVRK